MASMKSVYINPNKVRAVISNTTFKEHKVYEAHTSKAPGYIEYVLKADYDRLKRELDIYRAKHG